MIEILYEITEPDIDGQYVRATYGGLMAHASCNDHPYQTRDQLTREILNAAEEAREEIEWMLEQKGSV